MRRDAQLMLGRGGLVELVVARAYQHVNLILIIPNHAVVIVVIAVILIVVVVVVGVGIASSVSKGRQLPHNRRRVPALGRDASYSPLPSTRSLVSTSSRSTPRAAARRRIRCAKEM